ncbi:MAG TPA: recombinase family protein, partial [Rickettsia endosymbiont of Omalisus fontisbellaquei]|nr:recombinase family protein [Rickettsia endosymbiont of Omalisus fontisbellaquei]
DHTKAIYVPETMPLQEIENAFKSMKMIPELRQEITTYIKTSANVEKDYNKRRLTELYCENTKIETRISRLKYLFLDGDIKQEEYKETRSELEQTRENNMKEIEAHNKTDDSFTNMLIALIELAFNAHKTFIGSTIAEKRNLVNLVFANLTLKPKKLDFMLRPPFDTFVEIPKNEEWRTLKDSNL